MATRGYVDTSGITTQQQVEKKLFVATPPAVDLIISEVTPDSGGTDGVIGVIGTSPDYTATSFEYDIDAGALWTNTDGVFTALAAGVHTVQGRDADTPANVSVIISIEV